MQKGEIVGPYDDDHGNCCYWNQISIQYGEEYKRKIMIYHQRLSTYRTYYQYEEGLLGK